MRNLTEQISYEEARAVVLDNCHPLLRKEKMAIATAYGRVLAADVVAVSPTPLFNRSAMDGYAVKACDTIGASSDSPVRLHVLDTVFPDMFPYMQMREGECVRVCTGSAIPAGADAVVRQEDAFCDGLTLNVKCRVSENSFIALAGSDIRQGELLISEGTVLDPGKIGVMASQGIDKVEVYSKPLVAIIPTGDEIVSPGCKLKKGQIYDINSSTLAALVSENGGLPYTLPVTRDEPAELSNNLNKALVADLVVISGGSSVGEKDLIQRMMQEMGEVVFHGIRIKPGSPTALFTVQGKPVLGMPGPPTACLMNAYLFLVPAIRKMARLPLDRSNMVKAKFRDHNIASSPTTKSVTVKVTDHVAVPTFKKAGDILCTAVADGYIVVGENSGVSKDTEVLVTLF